MLAVRRFAGVALMLLVLGSAAVRAQSAHAPDAPGAPARREVSVGEDRFQKATAVPAWVDAVTEVPATKLAGPIVNLLADTQMLVADKPSYHVHRAIVANTPASLQNVARFAIDFNPAYQSVELHTLRLRRDGKVLDRLPESKIKFLQRETDYDVGLYTGNVTASVIIPDLRVGDTFEYEYTVTGANPVLGGRYVQEVSWDQADATQLRRVTLWVPHGRDVHWRMQGGGAAVEPTDESVGTIHRIRWEGRELPRTELESGTPASSLPVRYLRFSEFRDWNDVARWASALFDSAQGESAELRSLVAKFAQLPTADERASAALAWVQANVRYVSLSLGESSHRPSPAVTTLDRRYGDCKDKSALLVQMLRAMGMTADPVLVSADFVRGLDKHLPSPHSFDHAIVRAEVDGKVYFLDPTRSGQQGRLARMGQRWEGADVLVVRTGTTGLTQVRGPAESQTESRVEEKVRIAAWDKPATLDVTMMWTGTAAEGLRVDFAEASDERVKRYLLKEYERRYPGYKLLDTVRIADDKQANQLFARFTLSVPSIPVSEAERWGVPFEANNIESALDQPDSAARRTPFALPYPMSYRYFLDVEFPGGVTAGEDPGKIEVRPPGLYFAYFISFRANRATAHMDLMVLRPQVEADEVRAYMKALQMLRRVSRDTLWLAKTAQLPETAAAASTLAEREQFLIKARIERVSASLRSGKLKGEDLANAYCTRAQDYATISSIEPAMLDLDRALKANADLPGVQYCRGVVLGRAGRLKEAAAAYGQAIVLDPAFAQAYQARGMLKLNTGDFEAALTDFGAYGRARSARKAYAQLWTAIATRRMGREPDPAAKSEAQRTKDEQWPAPAVAMMYDLITPDDLIAIANKLTGDDRELTLVEAYHAIGQWHLARGEKTEAATYFRKAADLGVVKYFEHESSLRELSRLDASK